MGVFDQFKAEAYPIHYRGRIRVGTLAGGIPRGDTAKSWIETKLKDKDDTIRQQVFEAMQARIEAGQSGDDALADATEEVKNDLHLNGFMREPETGELYIEGRQLKAALKEGASIASAVGKIKKGGWAKIPQKGVKSFLAEHLFVVEDKLMLGVTAPTDINQRFVSTRHGSGIALEEYVEGAEFEFTVITDQDLTEKEWAMIWLTSQMNGIGATRSQGYGRYEVIAWEQIDPNQEIDTAGLEAVLAGNGAAGS